MKKQLKAFVLFMNALCILGSPTLLSESWAGSQPFPAYECIEPNVEFWKKVYTQYSREDCVVHDKEDLSIIFEVIKLEHRDKPGARKTNRTLMKKAKEKYRKTLEQLAQGKPPSTQEEKRVAAMFGQKADRAEFRQAMDRIRCQVGVRERFREGIIRSGAYLEDIEQILAAYGLPLDLAYLPHVESSFDPSAYSRFGAAGIWQFARSTGKRYMSVDYTIDERRDPIRSTHAAAQFLKDSYEKLGDWPMAITAYNHGVAGMLRAKKSKGTYEAIFREYRSRTFKFASRNFYSEFLAAWDVAKNYERYFGELELKKPLKSRKVVLGGFADIKDLACHFNVDAHIIRDLNPALRKPVFSGQKYVPKGYALRLPLNTSSTSDELPSHLYKAQQKRSRFHRVQKGDTAGGIARRYGIKLSDLILANNLNSRATIFPGQYLRLPVRNERIVQLAFAKSSKTKAKEAQISESRTRHYSEPGHKPRGKDSSEVRTNPSVVMGELNVERVISRGGKHIGLIRVEAEETLGHYADWLGIATQRIRRLNGFRYGKIIRINEQVKIPLEKVSKDEFEGRRFEYHKEIEEDFFATYKIEDVKKYKIRNGDNIWTLCYEVFDVPFWLVKKYNPDMDFNGLNPLQEILVPNVERRG